MRRDYLKHLGFATAPALAATKTPMTLPKLNENRIEDIFNEAQLYAHHCPDVNPHIAYTAGATEWAGKAQPVIDAAEKVAKIFAHTGDHQTCAICQLAKALHQWKGREVTNG